MQICCGFSALILDCSSQSVVFRSPCIMGVYCQASTVFAQRLSNEFILSPLPVLSHADCYLLQLELEDFRSYLNLNEIEESEDKLLYNED